jgi:hypothetical protein
MLSGIGKDAGATAAETLHQTVEDGIQQGAQAVKSIEDHAAGALLALVADIASRLNGAEVPVDITIEGRVTIKGKIGALKLSEPEYEVKLP